MIAFFDPADPATRFDPYSVYARLREEAPVFFRPRQNDAFISRARDIRALLVDPRLAMTIASPPSGLPTWEEARSDTDSVRRQKVLRAKAQQFQSLWFANGDGPGHDRIAGIARSDLLPTALVPLRSMIESRAATLIDQLPAKGPRVDLVADFAYPFAIGIISQLIGIPQGPGPELVRASRQMIQCLDLDASVAEIETGLLGIIGLVEYVRRHLHEAPPQSIAGYFLVELKEGRMSHDELLANLSMLLFAGHETTRHLVSSTFFQMLARPEILRAVSTSPDLAAAVVNETLRFEPPVQYVARSVLTSINLAEVELRAGVRIRLLLGSAGRDPAEYANPTEFDIYRPQGNELHFGRGLHYCLGAGLARLEAVIAAWMFAARFPHAKLAVSEPHWEPTFRTRGLSTLAVQLG